MGDLLHELSAAQAGVLIRERQISSVELVVSVLERIDALQDKSHAWATVAREPALAAARQAEQALHKGGFIPSPLHGVPFGVKDVMDTTGVETTAGFAPYHDRVPTEDAQVVAALRNAGAVMVGKTTTTQFAFADPSEAINPWSPSRTAGGSSSGSAVAVATRQVPLALGTQTGGSTLRPAAFNGVIGFKPTLGRLSTRGVLPLSWSLDHIGVIVRDVEDLRAFLGVTEDHPGHESGGTQVPSPPRLGLITAALDRADPEVQAHVRQVGDVLVNAGADVAEVSFGMPLELILAAQRLIVQVEASAVHRSLFAKHPSAYLPWLRACVEVGQLIPGDAYVQSLRLARKAAQQLAWQLDKHNLDALLSPTVGSGAPEPETTGDPSLQNPFTLAGMPSISLPSGRSRDGLPLAIQLAARSGDDLPLLAVASWCFARLEPLPAPPLG